MDRTDRAEISHLQHGISDSIDGSSLRSAAGSVPVEVLDRTLNLCIADHKELQGIHEVNPRFVLAHAWSENRLVEARKRLTEGIQDDPIDVTGIQFPGLPTYYLVTDGMHRTVASRLAGRLTIRAEVSGCYICDPHSLKLVSRVPWNFSNGEWHESLSGKESDAVVCLLTVLGVESLYKRQWALRRVPKAPPRRIAIVDPGSLK